MSPNSIKANVFNGGLVATMQKSETGKTGTSKLLKTNQKIRRQHHYRAVLLATRGQNSETSFRPHRHFKLPSQVRAGAGGAELGDVRRPDAISPSLPIADSGHIYADPGGEGPAIEAQADAEGLDAIRVMEAIRNPPDWQAIGRYLP